MVDKDNGVFLDYNDITEREEYDGIHWAAVPTETNDSVVDTELRMALETSLLQYKRNSEAEISAKKRLFANAVDRAKNSLMV